MKDFSKIKKQLLDEYCEKEREGKEIKAFLSGMNYLEDFLVSNQNEEYRLNEDIPDNVLLKYVTAELHREQKKNDYISQENARLKMTIEQLRSLSKNDKNKLKREEYIHSLIAEKERLKRELDRIIQSKPIKNI
uniref:hypothetical protein n=1 Tax=Bacteroides fragilis TaxID=817 RepID=UPI003569B072